jgi:hypothetical protein
MAWDRVTLILSIVVTGWFVTLPIEAPTNTTIGNGHLGSIASFWPLADDFRSSPASGHRHGRSVCLKSAINRHGNPVTKQITS